MSGASHVALDDDELQINATLIRLRSRLDAVRNYDDAPQPAPSPVAAQAPGTRRTMRVLRRSFIGLLMICFAGVGLHALPVLTEFVITGGVNGATVGTFDGGGTGLADISDLGDTSAADRQYVAQYFKPTVSGTYIFGLSKSNEDTVLILYSGTFDPSSPSNNSLKLNDDHNAPFGAGGVVMASCGAQTSYCPRISTTLSANTTYHIVVTSYAPNMTVSDGVEFYIYGEPVTVGAAVEAEEEEEEEQEQQQQQQQVEKIAAAPAKVARVVKTQTKIVLAKISNFESRFLRDVRTRHIRQQQLAEANPSSRGSAGVKPAADTLPASRDFNLTGKMDDHGHAFQGDIARSIKPGDSDGSIVIFGDFVHTRDKGKSDSKEINAKLAWEQEIGPHTTGGAFVGASTGSGKIKDTQPGDHDFTSVSLGAYAVHSPTERFHIGGVASLGVTRNTMKLKDGNDDLHSKFNLETATIGINATGLAKVYRVKRLRLPSDRLFDGPAYPDHQIVKETSDIELWPTFMLDYSKGEFDNTRTTLRSSDVTSVITPIVKNSSKLTLRASPELKFNIDNLNASLPENKMTVAPSVICEWTRAERNTSECGLGLFLDVTDRTGAHRLLKFELQNVENRRDVSASMQLSIPF